MKEKEAINKAKDWYDYTKEHAFVVDVGGTFEWYPKSHFDNGYEGGYIVYGTDGT